MGPAVSSTSVRLTAGTIHKRSPVGVAPNMDLGEVEYFGSAPTPG